jgi:hypothetical protein
MSGDLDRLSAETRALLAHEQRFPPESAELRSRALNRARAALLAGSAAPAPSFWRTRAVLLAAALLMTTFATAAVIGWFGLRSSSKAPASVPSDARAPRGAVASRAQSPAAPAPLVDSAQSAEAHGAALESKKSVSSARRPSLADTYALELAILRRARAAVASENFAAALDAVGEHQRRFPEGNLREERDALRVKALSGMGKSDEARAAAERFRERFPESVLAPRLEGTVRPAP